MNINKQIINYYEECDKSFQHWGEEKIYKMHFGFWEKNTDSQTEALENMDRVLAKMAKVKSGDKILDAGCGVGGSAIWLAKNFNVEVIGITLSSLQCRKANIFAKEKGVSDRVKFYIRDFTNTGFNKESFDIVWSIESVCHTLDKKDFIKEAKRVLKSGGRLIIADGFIKKEKLNKLDKFLLNNWMKGMAVPNLAKISDFQKYLKEVGFKNIEFTDITKNILPSSKEIFKRGILGWPIYKLKRRNSMQMNHVKGCIFQYLALKKDAWVYGVCQAER